MNVLDIDLDFFIENDRLLDVPEGRLSDDEYEVWDKQKVIDFLEKNCGLSKTQKVPGTIVVDHHEVFRHVYEKGFNEINLFHVDAHCDLYPASNPWYYYEYANKSVQERTEIALGNSGKMTEGNYIGFLLGSELLSKVEFITNFDNNWHRDETRMYFKNFDTNGGVLQLAQGQGEHDPLLITYDDLIKFCSFVGPEVPYSRVNYPDFQYGNAFDYVFLAKSPGYTPKSADEFIDVISEYLKLD